MAPPEAQLLAAWPTCVAGCTYIGDDWCTRKFRRFAYVLNHESCTSAGLRASLSGLRATLAFILYNAQRLYLRTQGVQSGTFPQSSIVQLCGKLSVFDQQCRSQLLRGSELWELSTRCRA